MLPEKSHDFRYLTLEEAMMYLNREIHQDRVPEVTKTLRETLTSIRAQTHQAVSLVLHAAPGFLAKIRFPRQRDWRTTTDPTKMTCPKIGSGIYS